MKILLVTLLFIPFLGFSQKPNEEIDLSKIHVLIDTEFNDINKAIFKIDDVVYPPSVAMSLNSDDFENVNVIKNDPNFPNGILKIKTKNNIKINPITLKDLVSKYTKLSGNQNIYNVNNQIINEKSNEYLIDENNVLSITIKEIDKADLKFNYIKINTKSKENIEDFKKSKLRVKK
ncbi:hypothetical protein [Algoriella sp.]|uniref:hypothetical protein n=1 Tax=Algoriella sp. TaxID=1872434 RepID=UPI002FCC0506